VRAMSFPTDGRATCLMKNFLRALRFVWPYRRRLVISMICALIAASLWGMNFLAIYPVVQVLIADKTPQTWVDERVEAIRKDIKKLDNEVKEQADREQRIAGIADHIERAKQERDLTNVQTRTQRRMERAGSDLWWMLVAKKYIDKYVPADNFITLVWVFAIVVVLVAVKGFFEFWQEVLVGSVVNLSLFD